MNHQVADSEFSEWLSPGQELQRHLFQNFTLIGLTFLLVYAVLQAKAGLTLLAILYTAAAVIVALNSWALRFHNRPAVAANVFVALGPVVLLPWQVTGGVADTGLMWFPAYVVFVMFFVPGWGGSFWVMFLYGASFFLLLMQLQGLVYFPFKEKSMIHFYFVGGITYALSYYFLHVQRIVFDVLKMQLAALQATQVANATGNWTWDIKTNTVELSDELCDVLGITSKTKVTYESYMKLVSAEDRQLVQETVEEAVADHQPYSLIHRVRRPDGSYVWMHSLGEAVLDVSGQPIKLVGTLQDITQRMARSSGHTTRRRKEKTKNT